MVGRGCLEPLGGQDEGGVIQRRGVWLRSTPLLLSWKQGESRGSWQSLGQVLVCSQLMVTGCCLLWHIDDSGLALSRRDSQATQLVLVMAVLSSGRWLQVGVRVSPFMRSGHGPCVTSASHNKISHP